jgi:hypothetical protein
MNWKSILCIMVILWKHYGSITYIITFIKSSKIMELYTIMDNILINNPSRYPMNSLLVPIIPSPCLFLLFQKQHYHSFINEVISMYVTNQIQVADVPEKKETMYTFSYLHSVLCNNSKFLYQCIISGKYVDNLPEAIHMEYVTFVHSIQKSISKQIIEIESTYKQVQLEFNYLYKLCTQYCSLCTYTFLFIFYSKVRSIGKNLRCTYNGDNLCIC